MFALHHGLQQLLQGGIGFELGQVFSTEGENRLLQGGDQSLGRFPPCIGLPFGVDQGVREGLENELRRQGSRQSPFLVLQKEDPRAAGPQLLVHARHQPDRLPQLVPETETDALPVHDFPRPDHPRLRGRRSSFAEFTLQPLFAVDDAPGTGHGQFGRLEEAVVGVKNVFLANLPSQPGVGHDTLELILDATNHQVNPPVAEQMVVMLQHGHRRASNRPQPLHTKDHHPSLGRQAAQQFIVEILHRRKIEVPLHVDRHHRRRRGPLKRNLVETALRTGNQLGQIDTAGHLQQDQNGKQHPHENRIFQR